MQDLPDRLAPLIGHQPTLLFSLLLQPFVVPLCKQSFHFGIFCLYCRKAFWESGLARHRQVDRMLCRIVCIG